MRLPITGSCLKGFCNHIAFAITRLGPLPSAGAISLPGLRSKVDPPGPCTRGRPWSRCAGAVALSSTAKPWWMPSYKTKPSENTWEPFKGLLSPMSCNTPSFFDARRLRVSPEFYGPIEQPVSEFDCPSHSFDGEQRGIPLDPERLYDFYGVLQQKYVIPLGHTEHRHIRARNYSIAVLAGESGLRADELAHLEISKDLLFESKKLQTRWAKATHGSGKRTRPTLYPARTRHDSILPQRA